MPKVATLSASILSADLAHLADQVKLVEPYADVFHIDIMDARFVPPLTIGPVVVAALRPHTDRTLHGHLQVEAPEAFFDELDGGVKLDNAERCVEAGATVIVAATGIFQAPDIAAAARDLALVAGRGD